MNPSGSSLKKFLPTPSARRATLPPPGRSPPAAISTHALREEGDTILNGKRSPTGAISTHALREEGDPQRFSAWTPPPYFYPRPPRGGRLQLVRELIKDPQFLPTPSARRATTITRPPGPAAGRISTHALREEGDSGRLDGRRHRTHFYPRPPRGGRRRSNGGRVLRGRFLPTPSARRATQL